MCDEPHEQRLYGGDPTLGADLGVGGGVAGRRVAQAQGALMHGSQSEALRFMLAARTAAG